MELLYDFSVAIIASYIFYVFQVYIPENRKKQIIKSNFKKYWIQTKKNVILILLQTLGCGSLNVPGIIDRLVQVKEFSRYFNEAHDIELGQTKWHGVLNGLNDKILTDIKIEFELFIKEIDFVLLKLEVNGEIIEFLKRLQAALYYNRQIDMNYGEEKRLSWLLREVFGGRSSSEGQKDYDIIENMIDKI